jgi:hypothetical protein
VEVGTIPAGWSEVLIELVSGADVDLQLIDATTGTEIVAWPGGLLNNPGFECAGYQGLTYCYSGYNGVGGVFGNEFIQIQGVTNRPLTVQVFGYQAGAATVATNWEAREPCSGSFGVFVQLQQTTPLGGVPLCVDGARLDIESDVDVDLQLIDDTDGTLIVGWPSGLLNGPTFACIDYHGVEYCYSGYNGVAGQMGTEYIEINGVTNRALSVQAFGYAAGPATVSYTGTALPGCFDPADIDRDGVVAVGDLLVVLAAWGPCPPVGFCAADIDGGGAVEVTDLLAVLGSWSG